MCADVVFGGAAKTFIKFGIHLEHDVPAGPGAALAKDAGDLLLAHVAVVDVHLDALARVPDELAVAGADDLEVGEVGEHLERTAVVAKVVDGGGAAAEECVTGEEDAFVFEVVDDGIGAVAGCEHDTDFDAAIKLDDFAVGEGADAAAGEAALEEGQAVLGSDDVGLELRLHPFEVAAVVGVVMGDACEGDLGLFGGGEVALNEPVVAVDGLAGIDGEDLAIADGVDARVVGVHGFSSGGTLTASGLIH